MFKVRLSIFLLVSLTLISCATGFERNFDELVEKGNTIALEEKTRSEETILQLERDKVFVEFPVLNRIVEHIQTRLYPGRERVALRVARLPGENAFALPDGTVVIHLSLLATLENIEQLAFVLAHEIAHIELNHGFTGAIHRRSERLSAHVTDVLTFGLANTHGRYVARVNSKIRGREYAADQRAADVLHRGGYSLKPAMEFFHALDNYPSFQARNDEVSTHPTNLSRLDRLRKYETVQMKREDKEIQKLYLHVRKRVLEASVSDKIIDFDYVAALIQLRELAALAGESIFTRCATADAYHSMSLVNAGYYSDQIETYLGPAVSSKSPLVYEADTSHRFLGKAETIYKSIVQDSEASECGLRGLGLVKFSQKQYVEARLYLENYLRLKPASEDRLYIQRTLDKIESKLK